MKNLQTLSNKALKQINGGLTIAKCPQCLILPNPEKRLPIYKIPVVLI